MSKQTYLTMLCLCLWAGIIAQTSYIGPAGGDWFTATNWNNGLPANGNNALIGGGNSVAIIAPLTVDFTIENYGDIAVTGDITNNGNILNGGVMSFSTTANLGNFGSFQNTGTTIFSGASNFNNNPGAVLTNSGSFTLETLLDNKGDLTNNGMFEADAGTILTQGAFNNNQTLNTQSLFILSSSTFTNNFGANLNISDMGDGIMVKGILNNFGTITNEGNLTIENILTNVGLLVSMGDIEVKPATQLVNDGTLENLGTVTNKGSIINGFLILNQGFINSFGQFINNNELRNKPDSKVIIRPGGTMEMNFGAKIENEGVFDNRGILSSMGNIFNRNGGELVNAGNLQNKNGSLVNNEGLFTNNGTTTVQNIFDNNSSLENKGAIKINTGGVFTNNGDFLNLSGATVTVNQDFFNAANGFVNNQGTFTINVRASIDGDFINNNLIDNQGDMTILPDGSLTNNGNFNQNSGNLLNQGTLENLGSLLSDECSTVSNQGVINNNGSFILKGILFEPGESTTSSVTVTGGYIHTSPNDEAPALCKNGTFGADIHGEVKVYASELVAFDNFADCDNMVYLADGLPRPIFTCSDIGSVLLVDLELTTRFGDKLTCTVEVTPVDLLEPQFTTPCPSDVFVTTTAAEVPANWTVPVAIDNCSSVTMIASNNPGDIFAAGNTTVTYTALDEHGNEGTCSFNVIVTGLTTCTQNLAPANNAIDVNFSSIALSWAASPNAILYDVYLGTANPPTQLVAPNVPATSATVFGLLGDQVYYWYVVPRNLNGDATGCTSNVTSFTTKLPCDNVTDAGAITGGQTLCNANDPSIITSLAGASGGTSNLEYVWEKTTGNPALGSPNWTVVPGADMAGYDPSALAASCWFRRGARRAGCVDYSFTQPVAISLVNVPTPVLSIQQPDCSQPTSAAVITNLPQNGHSFLDSGSPVLGKTTYSNIPAGHHVITISLGGCKAFTDFEINNFYTAPTAVCKSITTQLSGGSITMNASAFDNGSTGTCLPLNFKINGQSSITFNCSNIGTNPVMLQLSDALGGSATCSTTITIKDEEKPTVTCMNISLNLNSSGQASIISNDVVANAMDNCSAVTFVSVEPNQFSCNNIGIRPVQVIAKDASGNVSTCTALVTVKDNTPPTLVCKNITANLDANGQASIVPNDVLASSFDQCGAVTLQSVQPNQFFCGHIGNFTVQLTARDASNNLSSCTAIITVKDILPPTVTCKNKTLQLDANGKASILANDVYVSASDNCAGVTILSVQPSQFTCGNLGNVPVQLTVKDASGNTGKCTATVTVEDKIAPTVVCKNTSVLLDANGLATIAPADVFKNGADNCGSVSPSGVIPSTFNYASLGQNTVTLNVNDLHGNTATCTATVEVKLDSKLAASYTILADEEVHVHKTLIYGNVGIWKDGKSGKIHDNTTVHGFLKAPVSDVDDKSLVTAGFMAGNAPTPGTFKYNTWPDPNDDTKVPDNYPGVFLLNGTHFKKIEIGKNSTAKFTAKGEIFISELKTKDADEGKQTTLLFSGTTELVVRKRIEFGKRSAVNADGAGCVKIYGEEDDVIIKENSVVKASIDVRFKNLKPENAKQDKPTILTGLFVAKKVDGGDFVEWNWEPFPCGQILPPTAPIIAGDDQLGLAATTTTAGVVSLEWVTNTEFKNESFVIERSYDGLNFEPILEVGSQKESGPKATLYHDQDEAPVEGTNFYRVRAVFGDGTSMLSPIRLAMVGLNPKVLTLYPNPAQHQITMFWEKYAGKAGQVTIANSFGIEVLKQDFEALPDGPVQLELGNQPEGMYWLTLAVDGHRTITSRFMVAKAD
jgi:hypothetical protein